MKRKYEHTPGSSNLLLPGGCWKCDEGKPVTKKRCFPPVRAYKVELVMNVHITIGTLPETEYFTREVLRSTALLTHTLFVHHTWDAVTAFYLPALVPCCGF